MKKALVASWLVLACGGCAQPVAAPPSTTPIEQRQAPTYVRWFAVALDGIKAQNPEIALRVGHHVSLGDENVLFVDYPKPTADPAGRDVWIEPAVTDWSHARALSFRANPDHAMKLSVSFLDRNRVAYTAWFELQGSRWNDLRLAFDAIQPNPHFQPPDARPGLPIDVSEVKALGFAPQDEAQGSLGMTAFTLTD